MSDIRSAYFALGWVVPLEPRKIGVFVTDDHVGMREGITAIVNAQPDMTVVGEAGDGREAIEKIRQLRPDVSLLDWNLPITHGEVVLATIMTEAPLARFIVISTLNDEACIRRAFSLGARCYLHKDMLRRETLAAIRVVIKGGLYIPEPIAARLKNGR